LVSVLSNEGFDVSWASGSPAGDAFCFGTEDGKLVLTGPEGAVRVAPAQALPSGEAVNGVAFSGRRIAVSSRAEVVSLNWTPDRLLMAPIPFGAHGVITGAGGRFIASLGRKGILYWTPRDGAEQDLTRVGGDEDGMQFYCYRLASLQSPAGLEVLACAGRRGGVATLPFAGEQRTHTVGLLAFGGLDVVDVCPLVPGEPSLAAAALGRDGTIIMFRDVLREHTPMTFKYESVKGVAYRLFCSGGNLFLLTSEALHVITGVAERILTGSKIEGPTPVLHVPMKAVDANPVGDRWVLIVTPEAVLRFDVDLLERHKPGSLAPGELRRFGSVRDESPVAVDAPWKSATIERDSVAVALP
jgi:hypothetical protein